MESLRKAMHEAIEKHGLESNEALKASQELDKHIALAQKQKLTKDEFMKKVINDKYKKRYGAKNEADLYMFDKRRACDKKDAQHKRRQPHWKSK